MARKLNLFSNRICKTMIKNICPHPHESIVRKLDLFLKEIYVKPCDSNICQHLHEDVACNHMDGRMNGWMYLT
jgi:hypothetical protein